MKYTFSIAARIGKDDLIHVSGIVEAESQEEAEQIMLEECKKIFPAEKGHFKHSATVDELSTLLKELGEESCTQ